MLIRGCPVLTDLAPAHTTATGVLPSSVRSAEMSMLTSPPLQHTTQTPQLVLLTSACTPIASMLPCTHTCFLCCLAWLLGLPACLAACLRHCSSRPSGIHAVGALECSQSQPWPFPCVHPCRSSPPCPAAAHLCTPPMPPVTNTLMPARAASSMVPLTVVAPSRPLPMTRGMSRRDTLRTARPRRAMCSSCCRSQPAGEGTGWGGCLVK